MIGDTEALQFHVAEPGAQFRSLALGIQSGQDNQHAHQPYDQCERGEPHLDAKIHRRLLSNLAEERIGWPQEPAAPVKPRREPMGIPACIIHAHGKVHSRANFS
jgi:hypothetical protein